MRRPVAVIRSGDGFFLQAPREGALKATIQPEDVTAVIDTREQLPLDLAPLATATATLDTGDYSLRGLEGLVRVERKSLPDLVSCVGPERERFSRELVRLRGFPHRLLVVEATWENIEDHGYRSKTTPASVIGSLLAWMSDGIPVAMAGDHGRAGRFVSRISNGNCSTRILDTFSVSHVR